MKKGIHPRMVSPPKIPKEKFKKIISPRPEKLKVKYSRKEIYATRKRKE